ncbi:hypothetical protein ISCGN_003964 [Ixodes scapularis]
MPNDAEGSGSSNTQAGGGASFFNSFAVELPEKLDFRNPNDWKRWITRWERYRIISGLHLRDASTQVNTFLYAMGREAEDVLSSLNLTENELIDYDVVKAKFDTHFIPRVNIIFERAKFNSRKQEPDEPVEVFITALHKLADTCEYGSLRDELIRDRIVLGGKKYVVIVDYYSKFFELEELPRTTTEDLTKVFSQVFARHGCSEVIRSDNGPQFGSSEFRRFAKHWRAQLVTSSSYYPQSNGEAERAVQTAKNLLTKSSDAAKALLAHRTTPGPVGFSPAELLMGRKLRSTLPSAPATLRPHRRHSKRYR